MWDIDRELITLVAEGSPVSHASAVLTGVGRTQAGEEGEGVRDEDEE